jgi:hypothetical protein
MFNIKEIENLISSKLKRQILTSADNTIDFTDIYTTPEEKIQNLLLNNKPAQFQNEIKIKINEDYISVDTYLCNVLYNEYIRVFSFVARSKKEFKNILVNIKNMKKIVMFDLNIKKSEILNRIKEDKEPIKDDFYAFIDKKHIKLAKKEIIKQNNIIDIKSLYIIINNNQEFAVKRYLINLLNEIVIKKISKSFI